MKRIENYLNVMELYNLLTFSKYLFIIFIMKIGKIVLLSLFLILAGCGGTGSLTQGSGTNSTPSGYKVEVLDKLWNPTSQKLTIFFTCIPPQNTTILSMRGEFSGPTSGQFTPILNSSTNIWIADVILPQGGTYVIKIYATDTFGNETLILTLQYTTPSSGSGGGGSGGGDTPPPPPF
jgi:hypothetical protein